MATELITNGSFETGTGVNPQGWTGAGNARVDRTAGLAADGTGWYNLSADGPAHGGAVSQTIATQAGKTYTITFKAGIGWQQNAADRFNATMNVDMLSGGALIKSQEVELSSNKSVGWGTYTVTFTATGPQTTIRFADTSPGGQADFDVGLDKVSVQEASAGNIGGEWGDVQPWPVIPIHSVVTQDGKVLTFGTNLSGGQGATMYHDLYDPVTKTHLTIDHVTHTPTDIFCSAAIIIPGTDKILISGGDARPLGAPNQPVNDSNFFSNTTHQVSTSPEGEMSVARWYNTMVSLSSGQILNIGGLGAGGVVEIFTEGEGWRKLPGAYDQEVAHSWTYPRAWVGGTGEVFYYAAGTGSNSVIELMALDPSGLGSIRKVGVLPFATDSVSPAIMYEAGKTLIMASNGELWTMDITGATPKFAKIGLAGQDRNYSNMTLLADGKVLINGGTNSGNAERGAIMEAALWDPDTGLLSKTPAEMYPRLYHSTSVLLADGTVLVGGGGSAGMAENNYLNTQIYKPPYLFDASGNEAARPVITGAPKEIEPGENFTFTVDNAAAITKLTFIKTGATTHTFNMDARSVDLAFTKGPGNTITVQTPANVNDMTAGSWMLFAWNDKGVPSVAPIIAVEPTISAYEADGGGGTLLDASVVDPDNLVINGSFEAFQGDLGKTSWTTFANGKVGGWQGSTGVIKMWSEGLGMTETADGRIAAEIEATTGTLSQQIKTEAGETYDLSFDFAARPDAVASSKMEVLWNGKVVATILPTDAAHKIYKYQVTGTGAKDTLAFRSVAGDNDTLGGLLDKVALTETPASGGVELITNGGFEHGSVGYGAVSGWTLSGAGGTANSAGRAAEGGQFFAFDGWTNAHTGVLTQTINTVAGQTYTLKMNASINIGPANANGQIRMDALNGASVVGSELVRVNGDKNEYQMTFVATSSQTVIRLSDVSPKGQADFDIDVDMVSVKQASGEHAPATNLLSNSSFEVANGAKANTYSLLKNGEAGAWQSSTNQIEVWNGGYNGVTGTDGQNVVEVDNGNGVLSQTVKTEAGKYYGISFDYAGRPGYIASSKMEVLWNGEVIGTVTPTGSTMSHYHFHASGTGGNDVLAFRSVAGDTDGVGGLLDKVELVASSHPAPSDKNMIHATAAGGYVAGTDGGDHFMGAGANDIFYARKGDDIVDGAGGDYNQVDLDGAASDWTFTRNADGSVKAVNATFGTKTLTEIDGVFFYGSGKWASLSSLITESGGTGPGNMIHASDAGGYYAGTDGADHFMGGAGVDVFYARKGDDIVDGGGGDYNQLDLNGSAEDWTFSKNADGSVKAVSAAYGTKTLTHIDGVFFYGSAKWASVASLATAAAGSANEIHAGANGGYLRGTEGADHFFGSAANDTFVGRAGNDVYDGGAGYNQVDLAGSIADWDFSRNADGSVTATHATQGTDTLHDIGGIWFETEAEWRSVSSLLA